MDNYSDIGKSHLEKAESKKNQANILGTIVVTMILLSWLSNEYLLFKNKFDSLIIYQNYNKLQFFESYNSKYTDYWPGISDIDQNIDTTKINDKIDELNQKLDSVNYKNINPEIFETIEKSLPNPFPYILRQNIEPPYGLIFSSITLVFLVFYFSINRKIIIKNTAIGLRIIKKEDPNGLNPYFDYGLTFPFWVFPLHKLKATSINIEELIKVGSNNMKEKTKLLILKVFHFGLVIIHIRLIYISFFLNEFSLDWIIMIQFLAFGLHLFFIISWFIPFQIQNTLKYEEVYTSLNRRSFISFFSVLIPITLLGIYTLNQRTKILASFLNPRRKIKNPNSQHKKSFLVKSLAINSIMDGNYQEAYIQILNYLEKVVEGKNKAQIVSSIMLFDLQRKIIFKFQNIKQRRILLKQMIKIGRESKELLILEKMNRWENKYIKTKDSNKAKL